MPAAAARALQKGLKKGAKSTGLRYGAQMGGPVKRGASSQMGGPVANAALRYSAQMGGRPGLRRGAMSTKMGGPGDRGPGGLPQGELSGVHGGPASMPAPGRGQPEAATGAQGPAVMPPDAAAAPMPTGGSGASADVGTGGKGAIDMGPTPKGVQDAGAGGGGRLLRPGSGLIQPAAPIRPLDGGESVPAAVPPPGAQAEVAPMAKMMASRQPMSGFQPRRKPKSRPGYFTGA